MVDLASPVGLLTLTSPVGVVALVSVGVANQFVWYTRLTSWCGESEPPVGVVREMDEDFH